MDPLLRVVKLPFQIALGREYLVEGLPLEALYLREPRPGEAITVLDASGREYRARILELSRDRAKILPFEEQPTTELPFQLWLLQALPDKERMELILQKATELGVHVIVPFKAARSISLEEREARQPKAHRWPVLVLKATKQCRRAYLPLVTPYCSFAEAVEKVEDFPFKVILYERASLSLGKLLLSRKPPAKVALMVGPEGGWEEREREKAQKAGFIPVTLGPRVLRTETAAIAACAFINALWNSISDP